MRDSIIQQIDTMPSFRSTAQTALAAASLLNLEGQVSAGHIKSCPSNVGLSCHNTTAITDTCCTNSPGGLLLQTQSVKPR